MCLGGLPTGRSAYRGGSASRGRGSAWGVGGGWFGRAPPTRKAGGVHPTGILSCCLKYFVIFVLFF